MKEVALGEVLQVKDEEGYDIAKVILKLELDGEIRVDQIE